MATTVATAPSPARTGTSLIVASGHGADFGPAPFTVKVWPTADTAPHQSTAERIYVTAISTDTWTFVRAWGASSSRAILVGDKIDKVGMNLDAPAAVAVTATAAPAGGTGATAGAYDTSAHRDALIASVNALIVDNAALLTALRSIGLIS